MNEYDKNSLLRHYIRKAINNSDNPNKTESTKDIIENMKLKGTEYFDPFIETFNEALQYIKDDLIIKYFNDRLKAREDNTVKFNQFLIDNGITVPNYTEDVVEDDVEDDVEGVEGGRRRRKRKSRRRRKKSMKKSRKRRKSRGRKRKSRRRTRRRRK